MPPVRNQYQMDCTHRQNISIRSVLFNSHEDSEPRGNIIFPFVDGDSSRQEAQGPCSVLTPSPPESARLHMPHAHPRAKSLPWLSGGQAPSPQHLLLQAILRSRDSRLELNEQRCLLSHQVHFNVSTRLTLN